MKKASYVIMAVLMLLFTACGAPKDQAAVQTGAPSAAQAASQPVQTAQPPTTEPVPDGVKDTNILLMGSMEKAFSEKGSAYAMTHILITLDTQNRVIKFTTFPYNLAVNNGTKTVQLQTVCDESGEDAAVKALEDNFGISIDYWIVMNMKGVVGIVDTLGGIEINVESLSLNETSGHVMGVLDLVWQKVLQTGLQKLTGIQTAGYFTDTVPQNQKNWLVEEELLFRSRHSNILKGVIKGIIAMKLDSRALVTIAENARSNYATNIPEGEWESVAASAVYCLANEPGFYHVPQEITTVKASNGWDSIGFDAAKDKAGVQSFVGK
ncbi:MAG: LCP family protein [Christensenellales bacterium]